MAETLGYKCPNCGGELQFDSNIQKMYCKFCEGTFDVSQFEKNNKELENAEERKKKEWSEDEQAGLSVYQCSNCGGEIVGDDTLSATSCPYCDMPVVLKSQFRGDLRPDYIIPFKIQKKEATKKLSEFCRGKKLLPDSFLANNRVETLKGVYVPFWLYDADTSSDVTVSATRTKAWSDSSYNYTKTDYYEVDLRGDIRFDNIPVDGSSKMDDQYMESIEPYNYADMVPFNSAYLAGYLADKYDVDVSACEPRAKERLDKSVRAKFVEKVTGYASKSILRADIDVNFKDESYALLPVWMLSTNYEGQIYQYALNGQTGKFIGKLPIDKKKASRYFWSYFLGLGAVGSIIATLIFNFL